MKYLKIEIPDDGICNGCVFLPQGTVYCELYGFLDCDDDCNKFQHENCKIEMCEDAF